MAFLNYKIVELFVKNIELLVKNSRLCVNITIESFKLNFFTIENSRFVVLSLVTQNMYRIKIFKQKNLKLILKYEF